MLNLNVMGETDYLANMKILNACLIIKATKCCGDCFSCH